MTTQAPATAQAPAIACAPPDVSKPETWINRPLKGKDLPEVFVGKTYTSLATDEKGRLWLARERRNDPFAQDILKRIPHDSSCRCSACIETKSLDNKEVQPESKEPTASEIDGPTTSITSITPVATTPITEPIAVVPAKSNVEVPIPATSIAKPVPPPAKPPAAIASPMETSKKVKLKKQSVAGVETAEANLENTKRALEIEAPLNKILREAEEEEDKKFVADSVDQGSYVANSNRKTNRDDILKRIALRIDINNGWAAAWAAKQILLYEDILSDAKRQAQAIVDRAQRDYEIREKSLMPKLEYYCKNLPLDQRTSEKSIRPPGWSGRLTFRWHDEDYEIINEYAAKESAEERIGTDECIALGILKIVEKLSETTLREFLLANKEKAKLFQGVRYVPGQDKLTLYRS